MLGSPYLELWPRFAKAAEVADGLAFLSTDDWTSRKDASDLIGGVPGGIIQPDPSPRGLFALPRKAMIPRQWPFGNAPEHDR